MEKGEVIMIRNDGDYTIYILQHRPLRSDKDEWHDSGDGASFCKGVGDFKESPRQDFNACGMCWQKTGVSGTYDYDIAHAFLLMVAKNNPGRTFRIAKLQIFQETTEVCQISINLVE
jgi:hypothetical protein